MWCAYAGNEDISSISGNSKASEELLYGNRCSMECCGYVSPTTRGKEGHGARLGCWASNTNFPPPGSPHVYMAQL